jgi:hypothetical protein
LLGPLLLATPGLAGRPGHLSAASGEVRLGDRLYVVADDEPAIAVFELERKPLAAVAEAGESTYLDGEGVGSALGLLGADGVPMMEPLVGPYKIEGVSVAAARPDGVEVMLVADADDPSHPAPLPAASLSL